MQVLLGHGIEHLHIPAPPLVKTVLGLFPGVTIFFVISGYLITGSLLRSPDLASYARNRFLRIFPGLWMCSVVTLVLLYSTGQLQAPTSSVLVWILGQSSIAPHTPDFLRHWGSGSVNGSLWTIPVEIQFYLLLPVLVWWLRGSDRRQAWTMAVLIGTGVGYLWIRHHYAGTLPARVLLMSLFSWLYLFMVGVLLQLHRAQVAPLLEGKAAWWGAGYIVWTLALAAAGVSVEGNSATPLTTIPLTLFTISCAYTLPTLAGRLLRGQDLSYGIYIYHMLVINVLIQLQWTGSWWSLVLAASVSLAIAALSWRLLEAPALRLKSHPWARRQQTGAA